MIRRTVLGTLSLALGLWVATGTSGVLASTEPPRLVVIISIDQMRNDYIERYGQRWTAGLHRLVTSGARFVQAAYPYLNTVTCAGHATIATGAFPSTHGMVLNGWWDREAGRDVSCTEDDSATLTGYQGTPAKSTGHSARRLLAHTFADELRGSARRAPRIVSLSMKPRSAIMLAGRRADVVLWFDPASGMTTSSAYGDKPSPFVESFVTANSLEKELAWTWSRLLPESDYLGLDDAEGEQPPGGWTRVFPHVVGAPGTKADDLRARSLWGATPQADAYLAKLAAAAVEQLPLGQSAGTDVLAISFSVLDSIGHAFGPNSHEVQDVLFRLDQTLGHLLETLDRRVGAGRYVVAVTGDHGVSPIPEQARALGLDAGRVDLKALAAKVDELLTARLGAGPHLARLNYTDLYFAPGVFDKLKARPEVLREVTETIARMPGIARVLRSDRLDDTLDPLSRAARLSYHPKRSGDLLIVPRPYWLMSSAAATHGTSYDYDQRVPVVLYGAGIKRGAYWQAASPADIAPTLAALCGFTMAHTDGRILKEALEPPAPATANQSAVR
jgi:predicted AlkP superfamily pyrophosphatase or phosphodiesterase